MRLSTLVGGAAEVIGREATLAEAARAAETEVRRLQAEGAEAAVFYKFVVWGLLPGGERVRCEPSRFLSELPEDDLRWEGRGAKLSDEEKQARGKASLHRLYGLGVRAVGGQLHVVVEVRHHHHVVVFAQVAGTEFLVAGAVALLGTQSGLQALQRRGGAADATTRPQNSWPRMRGGVMLACPCR